MKIIIIADIHANQTALEAVLEDAGRYDRLLCAGDITGYCHDVNSVFETLTGAGAMIVMGNHDAYLLNKISVPPNPKVVKSVEYTKMIISPENLEKVSQLPESLSMEIGGLKISMFHGSPWNPLEEYIYPDYKYFNDFSQVAGDIIILGHTHYPLIQNVNEKIIINPGSTGQPRGESTNPSYATVCTDTLEVEIKYVKTKETIAGDFK